MVTVEAYLSKPASSVEVISPVDYFRFVLVPSGDPAPVAQRGRDDGAALGEDPASQIAERVLAKAHAGSGDSVADYPGR